MSKEFSTLLLFFLTVFTTTVLLHSCAKEYSCEGCRELNKPPVANAGPDQVIALPTDSILLDGSASNDPDGTISEWLWKKISGPASFNIVNTTTAKTVIRNLDTGVYKFELKVKDDKGLFANDTMQVIVDAAPTNHPPVANAGFDTTITLPADTINLNGNRSTDPDNNITSYSWTKISGPSSFTITNASAVQTQVTNLAEGVYQFELKVADAGGLFSKDTVQITVNVPTQSNRPPVANAGADQTIILPTSSTTLDGSGSSDPDNNITAYAWTKISGPSSFIMVNANAVQTQVTNLVEGVYQFELKVTDAGGLMAKDTVQVTVTATVCPQPSPPPTCVTNCGKIVFVSNRDGNDEIYTCNADGSNVSRLTNDPARDKQPVWSPDGTKIAFVKNFLNRYVGNNIYEGNNIYVMNADGSNVVQLTFTGDAEYPSWSPDGTKIAFTDEIDETVNVWVSTIKIVNSSNGSVLMQTGMYGSSIIPCPAWSPDGTKIAFDSDWYGWDIFSDIFTICPNGGNLNWLTQPLGDNDYWKPAWSPNGSKLSATIFPMTYQGGATSPASIGVMNPDGTGLTVIITGNMGGFDAVTKTSWSPDGAYIAYTSWATNNTKTIKWIAANGSGASGTIITNGWDADWKH